ncbi:ABC transporter substrate-binding protein [Blastococcus sp. PRF04-17]|uniref:ABC transporter substrate-binding protein n=1 Tax=Blastococcus sp. PRF04-17 TaxID=2933797 RepID=UPI001FF187B0|nr:ABC transporter substrate-binding protein [Blastococcus sp. PRF04-17]UOY02835.1 ABC transporter substrate-binding protein [Blastococcus sp. PRF04-17]
MRNGKSVRSIAVTAAAVLALAACGGGDEDSGGDNNTADGGSEEKQINVYGTDGNVGDPLGEQFEEPGALAGMKGTTPLTDLSQEFRDRLLEVDPNLGNTFNYAGESYDAVIITALASAMAQSNQATVFAPYVNGVTFGGDKCEDFASCLEIISSGGNPDYDGITGPLAFADPGEPAVASFGTLQFGDDNKLDPELTEYLVVGDEENAASDEGPAPAAFGSGDGTGPLRIGTLLPLTGNLAFLGPPEVAGVQLAINEINEAGGVLGAPVEVIPGDSGDTSTNIASQTVASHQQAGVNAIIGAASSDVTKTVIDTVTQAGILMFSPANTSNDFTTYDDNGLYFRTAPPDLMQGQVLADLITNEGNQSVGILAQNGEYGTGLAQVIVDNLANAGLGEDVVKQVYYDPAASDFSDVVQQMVDFNPDAIVVIGFDESGRIIQVMNEQGVGPAR